MESDRNPTAYCAYGFQNTINVLRRGCQWMSETPLKTSTEPFSVCPQSNMQNGHTNSALAQKLSRSVFHLSTRVDDVILTTTIEVFFAPWAEIDFCVPQTPRHRPNSKVVGGSYGAEVCPGPCLDCIRSVHLEWHAIEIRKRSHWAELSLPMHSICALRRHISCGMGTCN